MKCFGLAGSPPPGSAAPRRLSSSVLFGGVSFSVVSLLAYSIWAFRLVPGTAGLYSTTALVYVGLGGLALSRLVAAPGAWKRFPPCFALAFLAYAAGWCVFWFGLRGRYQADLFGAADPAKSYAVAELLVDGRTVSRTLVERLMPSAMPITSLRSITRFNWMWYSTLLAVGSTCPLNSISPAPSARPRPGLPFQPRKNPTSCHMASSPRQPGITGSPTK